MNSLIPYIAAILLFLLPSSGAAKSPSLDAALMNLKNVNGPFTFAVLGDNRSGDRVYKKVIHQMMVRKPVFVVNTGDVIPNPGDRDEWANFKSISQPITIPYFLAVGNHDIDDKKSQDIWREEVDLPGNETYYSFTAGRNLFVILNSCEPGEDRRIDGAQLKWLKGVLDPKKYDHQFIFLHHPLFLPHGSTYEGKSLDRYPDLRDQMHNLFVERGVTAVFMGHEHSYRRMEKDGIDYVITGGGGAPLYGGRETFNHVMIIDVDGPHVDAKVIDREGAMRDEFAIQR